MPELPEVETIRRSLTTLVNNNVIENIVCYFPGVLINPENLSQEAWLIKRLSRRGKYLIFELQSTALPTQEARLIVHLRMSGKLLYEDKIIPPIKHTHVRLILEANACLDFNDVRRFGRVWLLSLNQFKKFKPLLKLGPEPFSKKWTAQYLTTRLTKHRKTSIKQLLLNQEVVAGLGNIYVDESLFLAKIKPSRLAATITAPETLALITASKKVLKEAIGHKGTSLRDYVDGLGAQGFFQYHLNVYSRSGQACSTCGQTILSCKIAGRTTCYCPNCQT